MLYIVYVYHHAPPFDIDNNDMIVFFCFWCIRVPASGSVGRIHLMRWIQIIHTVCNVSILFQIGNVRNSACYAARQELGGAPPEPGHCWVDWKAEDTRIRYWSVHPLMVASRLMTETDAEEWDGMAIVRFVLWFEAFLLYICVLYRFF